MTDRPGSLAWRARYATHIPSLDGYHQGMFKVFRRLLQATRHGRRSTALGPILEFLDRYSRSHFIGEEAFMLQAGFPDVVAHVQEHRQFAAQLERLQEASRQGDRGIDGELILILSGWLSEHLLKQDRTFADFIHGRSTRLVPGEPTAS